MLYKLETPPEQQGYTIGESSNFADSKLQTGGIQRGKTKANNWQPVSVNFIYTADEYRAFQSFYVGKLKNGVLPFTIDLFLNSHELKEYTARFQPNAFSMRNQGEVFTITHNLLVKPRLDDNDAGDYALDYEAARFKSLVAFTFGLYPARFDSSFKIRVAQIAGNTNLMPRFEPDDFQIAPVVGGALEVTVAYAREDVGLVDGFVIGEPVIGGALETTIAYAREDFGLVDEFALALPVIGGALDVVIAYARLDLKPTDSFEIALPVIGGALETI